MIKAKATSRARVSLQGVIALPLLALVASCGNDATGPLEEVAPREEVTPLLIVHGDMGAQFQNLAVTRQGVAVTDGTVTVNGVAILHTGTGLYQGQLPTAVPAGSPLDLQVVAGATTVHGTVDVPEAPVLTAPGAGAVFAPAGSVQVRWTSATNPDRFVVYVSTNGSVWQREVPGASRELWIVAGELPAGPDMTISVVAYNDGWFSGPAHPDSRIYICRGGLPNAVITVPTEVTNESFPLLIQGGMGAQFQGLWIHQGGTRITDGVSDAVVTVNGVGIPNAGLYPAYYAGQLPLPAPPGARLGLRVSARGLIVHGTVDMPEAPVLTAPAATGAVFPPGGSVTVRWTSATNPDRFRVYANTNGTARYREVPGAARELWIATSEFPAGPYVTIYVVAYNDVWFSGPAHPDSRLGISNGGSSSAVITVRR